MSEDFAYVPPSRRWDDAIRQMWPKMCAREIGEALDISSDWVRRVAQRLDLGPCVPDPRAAAVRADTVQAREVVTAPGRPRGFDRATVEWAKAHSRDPEARLILGMLGLLPGVPKDGAARGMAG